MEIKDLMNPSVVTIEPTASAALAARLLSRHNVGSLPVCGEDRRLRGMVTDRDIVLRCVAAEEDPAQTLVRDIMTRGCASVSPHEDCRAATRLMAQQQVRRLPVVEEGKLVGIISLADLARSQRFDMESRPGPGGDLGKYRAEINKEQAAGAACFFKPSYWGEATKGWTFPKPSTWGEGGWPKARRMRGAGFWIAVVVRGGVSPPAGGE